MSRSRPANQQAILDILLKGTARKEGSAKIEEVRRMICEEKVCAKIAEKIRYYSPEASMIWRTEEEKKEQQNIISRYITNYTFSRAYSPRCHVTLMIELANDIRQLLGVKKTRGSYNRNKRKAAELQVGREVSTGLDLGLELEEEIDLDELVKGDMLLELDV